MKNLELKVEAQEAILKAIIESAPNAGPTMLEHLANAYEKVADHRYPSDDDHSGISVV